MFEPNQIILHKGTRSIYTVLSCDQYYVKLVEYPNGVYPIGQYRLATQADIDEYNRRMEICRRAVHLSLLTNRHRWICDCEICQDEYKKTLEKEAQKKS